MQNDSETCRKFVVPKLHEAGWEKDPHSNTERGILGDATGESDDSPPQRREKRSSSFKLAIEPPFRWRDGAAKSTGILTRAFKEEL